MLAALAPRPPARGLAEIIVDRTMHERGSRQRFDHPDLGRVVLPHSPLRFEGPCRGHYWTVYLPSNGSIPLSSTTARTSGDAR